MRLLLDSHALVWWLAGSAELSRRAYAAISEPDNDVWVSAVSGYELVNKARLGKLRPPLAGELVAMVRRAKLPNSRDIARSCGCSRGTTRPAS